MSELSINSFKETSYMDNQTPRSWHQKECIQTGDGIAVVNNKIEHPVHIRWYMGRSNNSSVVYCSVSISTNTLSTHGHGQAGGYGYCKTSAAFDSALRSASVELSQSISGTGRSRQAIEAIVKYLYPKATDIQVIGV